MAYCDYCGGIGRSKCEVCQSWMCHLHKKKVEGKTVCMRCHIKWKAKHDE